MAEKYLGQLTAKSAPATGDILVLEDSEDTKKIDYDALANAILNKLTTKTYTVGGGTQTLISAIDTLNSNTYSLSLGTRFSGTIDFDTLTTVGNYYCDGNVTATNGPENSILGTIKVEHSVGHDDNYLIQTYRSARDDKSIYRRIRNNGNWRSWGKLATDSDVPSQNYLDYWTVYPNGKLYNKTYFTLTIPFFNPKNKTPSVSSAYVYNDTGSFVDIKSSVTIETANNLFVYIQVIFDAGYAGRLARFTITLS